MAKKSITSSPLILGIVIVAVALGAFILGNKLNVNLSEKNVLGASTSTSSTTKASQVASAAYVKCIQNGGFVTYDRRGSWGIYSICNFADDMNCELYALYNGQCAIGGVPTVGYSTKPQVFCALRGGKPQGKENGQCKMPDGKICSTDSVYHDTCN